MWEATSQHEMEPSTSALLTEEPPGRSRGTVGQEYWEFGERSCASQRHGQLPPEWRKRAAGRESNNDCVQLTQNQALYSANAVQSSRQCFAGHFADGNTEASQLLREGRSEGVKSFYSTPIFNLRARSQNSKLEIS